MSRTLLFSGPKTSMQLQRGQRASMIIYQGIDNSEFRGILEYVQSLSDEKKTMPLRGSQLEMSIEHIDIRPVILPYPDEREGKEILLRGELV